MTYYLIDYENVQVSGLNGLNSLMAEDKVVIFYSDNSESLTFELHQQLMSTLCMVEYHKVETGTKNALDFQLSSYLGYVIKESENNPDNRFFIVTKDNGFSVLCTYWKNKNIPVEIVINLTGEKNSISLAVPEVMVENPDKLKKAVSSIITNKSEIDFVVSTVKKSRTKHSVSNQLNKHFKDGKKVHKIYTAIKPFIENMPGQ